MILGFPIPLMFLLYPHLQCLHLAPKEESKDECIWSSSTFASFFPSTIGTGRDGVYFLLPLLKGLSLHIVFFLSVIKLVQPWGWKAIISILWKTSYDLRWSSKIGYTWYQGIGITENKNDLIIPKHYIHYTWHNILNLFRRNSVPRINHAKNNS